MAPCTVHALCTRSAGPDPSPEHLRPLVNQSSFNAGRMGACGDAEGAYRALCARCAKSWPFSTTGSSVSSEDWKDVIEWLLQWTGL